MEKYNNTCKIAILLSTYNGERYLPEQLDSILSQKYQDFRVYVRDDGSSDQTMTILKRYCSLTDKIILLESNENMGATRSFLSLLDCVESQYYMFCDQDDVWYDYKVSDTYAHMVQQEQGSPNVPIIVYTDLSAVDANLDVVIESMWEFRGHQESLPHSYHYLCHYNDMDGCTMMMNNLAKRTVNRNIGQIPEFVYHDWFIALSAASEGGVIVPFPEVTMKFRRHGNNETSPTAKKRSVIVQPYRFLSFIQEQYDRYLFCLKIRKGSIFSFFFYKITYVILREFNSIKKHE